VQEFEQFGHVLIVVAHPDDEVIGAGALLCHLRNVTLIHTTDGSPRDTSDAFRAGFTTRERYALARRQELNCALRLAHIDPARAISLGFTDNETMFHLPELCLRLDEQLSLLNPDLILTHPYEGGHPDHDATAFAVHRCARRSDRIFELTSYHANEAGLETGVFLPNGEPPVICGLSPEDSLTKTRMLACFQSQSAVLARFQVVPEQFRKAPRYDFTRPPHAGALHYERLPWGITGEHWRELASVCPGPS
jgi:LmbE family N-acetylglucosaminyl deacetylase